MNEEYKLNYKTIEIENPMIDLSVEERINIFREIGKKASVDYAAKLSEIHKWVSADQDYDQTYLLSYCLRYFMITEDGYDEEAATGKLSFPPHYLEILQALSLIYPRNISAKPLWYDASILFKDMQELGELIQIKLFSILTENASLQEMISVKVRIDMMSYHIAVRNWGYFFQMKKVCRDMASLVSKEFFAIHNVDPKDMVELIFDLSEQVNERINAHLKKLHTALILEDPMKLQEAYEKAFLVNDKTSRQSKKRMWKKADKKLDNLRMMLMAHSNLGLADLFTFTVDELSLLSKGKLNKEQVIYLFDQISYEFGELKDTNQGFILLDNPVLDKPFIKLNKNGYYSSLWTTIPHLSINLLERFIKVDKILSNKYDKQRASYLEEELFELCKACFPSGKVYKGSKWLGDETEHTIYENDVLVVIDSFALIFEAKSRKLTKEAKRGAPDRLFETLQELIEEPSKQALRFIEYLKKNKGKLFLATKSGRSNEIDISNVNYFIPVGVTFYDLGVAGTNLKQIVKGNITSLKIEELTPSISITDLQIVFELLDSEPKRIHYLHRRRELEAKQQYIGTELDLLAFYLDTGFNIGENEINNRVVLELTIKSKDLDDYFNAKETTKCIQRPQLKMTNWWQTILQRMVELKPPRWIEISYVLLNFNKGDQIEFEEAFNMLKKKVRANEVNLEYNWVEFRTANEDRRYIIAGYAYRSKKNNTRFRDIHYVMEHIIGANPMIKGLVVVAVDVDNEHYPYNTLSGEFSVALFDDLFQKMSLLSPPSDNKS